MERLDNQLTLCSLSLALYAKAPRTIVPRGFVMHGARAQCTIAHKQGLCQATVPSVDPPVSCLGGLSMVQGERWLLVGLRKVPFGQGPRITLVGKIENLFVRPYRFLPPPQLV